MLLAGEPPFYKRSKEDTIEAIKVGKVEYPRKLWLEGMG